MAKVDIFRTRKKYDVLYADPPWRYSNRESLAGKDSYLDGKKDVVYPTMSFDEIASLPIPRICAPDCILFGWVVSPMMPDCIAAFEQWGFKHSTVAFVWEKQRINPGHYTLSSCELCLVFRRGKIPTPRGARNIRQFLSEKKGAHSAKPHEVRARIVNMFPSQKRVELFARKTFPGWDVWGNEV
jgi:N6-adenosine-specific RNA methylase IME4